MDLSLPCPNNQPAAFCGTYSSLSPPPPPPLNCQVAALEGEGGRGPTPLKKPGPTHPTEMEDSKYTRTRKHQHTQRLNHSPESAIV